MFGSMVRGRGARSADPLLLYATGMDDPEAVYALPEERKRVAVPVVGPDGAIHPAGGKTVWPGRCVAGRRLNESQAEGRGPADAAPVRRRQANTPCCSTLNVRST